MADLKCVKVSDMLLIPVKVIHVDDAFGAPVKVAFESVEFWLDRDTAQAAEHIPDPRIFKRGDWVKMHLQTQSVNHIKRHGIVAGDSEAGDNVPVLWPGCLNSQFIRSDLLEPDEAPE